MIRRNATLVVFAVIAAAQAQSPAGRTMRPMAELEPVLAKIATFQHGQSRQELGQLMEFVNDSVSSQSQLRQIELRLLRFLESSATPAAKALVFDQLAFIATDASIPLLVSMQARPETAETARFVLERIPGPAADEALRRMLASATGNVKIGIINSLGRRRDRQSVAALEALISSSNRGITEAALAALAGIADPPALKALAAARTKLSGPLREAASEAYVACADQLARRGDKASAIRMYREMIAPQQSPGVRIQALAGLARLEGRNALPALTTAMHSKDRGEQASAIMFLDGIPGPDSTKAMVSEFARLAAPGQVRILAALADRGDPSAKQLVLAALKSNSGDVRAAGLRALGKLGDESSVIVLAEAAADRPAPEQDAARQSLWGLRGLKIDAAIVEAIGSRSGKVKAELIAAAGERGAVSAADALAQAVHDGDQEVQRAALRALKNVGGSGQVPALVDVLVKAATLSDRRDATQTLSAVLRRSQPALISMVIRAYEAIPTVESRLSLLEVMGQSSNDEALPLLRGSLKDPNPEIGRAAILALTGWDSPAALPDLLAIARSAPDPALKILALRGHVKLIALPSQRPASESARLLTEAMRLANEPAEKRTVLSLLPAYPCQESLQLAQGALGDESVANEAKAAVARIRIALQQK